MVADRFDELVAVEWELEKESMRASVDELNVCLASARELVRGRSPLIGSSSLEEIKSLVARYQVRISSTIKTPKMDHSPIRQSFEFGKSISAAGKSILNFIQLPSLVAKYCKM